MERGWSSALCKSVTTPSENAQLDDWCPLRSILIQECLCNHILTLFTQKLNVEIPVNVNASSGILWNPKQMDIVISPDLAAIISKFILVIFKEKLRAAMTNIGSRRRLDFVQRRSMRA
jgi:hypothetical protein